MKTEKLFCGATWEYISLTAMEKHRKTCESCADNYAEASDADALIEEKRLSTGGRFERL